MQIANSMTISKFSDPCWELNGCLLCHVQKRSDENKVWLFCSCYQFLGSNLNFPFVVNSIAKQNQLRWCFEVEIGIFTLMSLTVVACDSKHIHENTHTHLPQQSWDRYTWVQKCWHPYMRKSLFLGCQHFRTQL